MGTMREADLKAMRRFCLVATVIIIVVALMTYANLFNTYLYDYFRAGVSRETNAFMKFTHYFGAVFFAAAVYVVWKLRDYTWGERGAWLYGFFALLFVALGILLAAGFNFDLHGIEPGA